MIGMVQIGGESALELASPGERLAARVVDTAIVIALTAVIGASLHVVSSPFALFEGFDRDTPLGRSEIGVLVAVWSLYEIFGQHLGMLGSMPGKDLLRIEVVRALDGGSLRWREAVNR